MGDHNVELETILRERAAVRRQPLYLPAKLNAYKLLRRATQPPPTPGVLTGSVLLVERTLLGMPKEKRAVIEAHFVLPGVSTSKAAALGLTASNYFVALPAAKAQVVGYVMAAHAAI